MPIERRVTQGLVVLLGALLVGQRTSPHVSTAPDVAAITAKSSDLTRTCSAGTTCEALIPYGDTGPWVASCAKFRGDQTADPASAAITPSQRMEPLRLDGANPESLGARPDWCVPTGHDAPALNFLIVLVPDPVTTHLALYFDRTVDAVDLAAQRFAYYLDRYWTPWRTPGNRIAPGDTSEEHRTNAVLDSYRMAQPGVMIFTAPSDSNPCAATGRPFCVTYAFLVGESPTSGINSTQFNNALKYTQQIDPTQTPLVHVIGPQFSGSTPSVLALTAARAADSPKLDFVSGTMTNAAQIARLATSLSQAKPNPIRFRAVLHDDHCAQSFLTQFLSERKLAGDGQGVALLQESETRFGSATETSIPLPKDANPSCPAQPSMDGSTGDRQSKLLPITFPREISRLRNGTSAGPATSASDPVLPASPLDGISWEWKDASSDEDTVPPYSGQQELMSQQAIMLSIVDLMRHKNIKYVGISATDVFDILFVSKFVKAAMPNASIFLFDADTLMVEGGLEAREPLGTLAVTTFPLVTKNDAWSPPQLGEEGPASSVIEFPSRMSAGIYSAVLSSFRGGAPELTPPLWLTMVSRDGFWPVRGSLPAGPQVRDARSLAQSGLKFDPPDGLTILLECALLAWGLIHLLGMRYATPTDGRWLRQFMVRDRPQIPRDHNLRPSMCAAHQSHYLLCATLALSAMLLLVVITYLAVRVHGNIAFPHPVPLLFPAYYVGALLTGIGLLGGAILISRRISRQWVNRTFQIFPWVIYVGLLTAWAIALLSGPDAIFRALRSFSLTNGVSPLLPIELLLLANYVWAWKFIHKIRLSEAKCPQFPALALLGAGGKGTAHAAHKLLSTTEDLVFNKRLATVIVAAVVVGMALLRPWETLRSVETRCYDVTVLVLVTYIFLLIVLAWARHVALWGQLSLILRALEQTPLRNAFSRLQNLYSWSELWYEDAERRSYSISARSVECYQAIARRLPANSLEISAYSVQKAFSRVTSCDERQTHDTDRCRAVDALQALLTRAAERLLDGGLRTAWEGNGASASSDASDELQALAEEFVAWRYVGVINYDSAQMRNLVGLLGVAFIAALAAVGSYPFLGGSQCEWTLAGIFVTFGAVIVVTFAQMSRDPIMSRLSGSKAGKLDWAFLLRVVSYGALPLLALLTSQFPSIGRTLTSWLEPALNALH